MSQHITERFNKIPKRMKAKVRMQVHHHRTANRAYNGNSVCVITTLDKRKRPITFTGHASVSNNESGPILKSRGYKIATERAMKKYLAFVGR